MKCLSVFQFVFISFDLTFSSSSSSLCCVLLSPSSFIRSFLLYCFLRLITCAPSPLLFYLPIPVLCLPCTLFASSLPNFYTIPFWVCLIIYCVLLFSVTSSLCLSSHFHLIVLHPHFFPLLLHHPTSSLSSFLSVFPTKRHLFPFPIPPSTPYSSPNDASSKRDGRKKLTSFTTQRKHKGRSTRH